LKNELKQILSKTSLEAAPRLLGWELIRELPQGRVSGKIVEVEAYHQDDPASHSYRGLTPRTAPMFEAGGHIYVYFTYGTHYCLNIVTGKKGAGEAVLIRALEPTNGFDFMKINRKTENISNLTNGPGKLTQAIGINNTQMSGQKLGKLSLYLVPPKQRVDISDIMAAPRIGITRATENHWRFYLKDNPFVFRYSKRPISIDTLGS
jgi:DNA-3-methyladenine glycosylase